MQYVRRIEFDSAEISGDQGYKGQRREMHPDCYTGPPGVRAIAWRRARQAGLPVEDISGLADAVAALPGRDAVSLLSRREFPRWLRER